VAIDSDEEDDDDISKLLVKPSNARKQAQPAKPLAKLSVGEEEEGDIVFKKKKKKPKARGVSTLDLDQTNGPSTSSTYSAQALADLKSKTPQMPTKFAENRKSKEHSEGAGLCVQDSVPGSGATCDQRSRCVALRVYLLAN
jgi:hypothetical protein